MRPITIGTGPLMEELAMMAVSLHKTLRGMPIAMKARHMAGILIEDGEPRIAPGVCNALDGVLSGDQVQRIHIDEGRHAGATMFASALVNGHGQRVAAIGVIDTFGLLSLEEFVANSDRVERQLKGRKPRK